MPRPVDVAVVISDLHIGDDQGVVRIERQSGYEPRNGLYFRQEFLEFENNVEERCKAATPAKKKRRKIPYLVLNGDAWDVAIKNLDEVADLSQDFFTASKLDRLFEQIIFLPGNHDHHLWRMLQTQTCVVRPLENTAGRKGPGGPNVHPFPQAQCGFLSVARGRLEEIEGVQPPYEGRVFLTGLTGRDPERQIPVNVVYPNLYVSLEGSARTALLITHGHFFEAAWRLLTEMFRDLLARKGVPRDLFYLEMLNSPLTEFFNFSLAQVGPVSSVVNDIYNQVRNGGTPEELKMATESMASFVDRSIEFEGNGLWSDVQAALREKGTDALIKLARKQIETLIRSAIRQGRREKPSASGLRGDVEFLEREDSRQILDRYLLMSRRKHPNHRISTLIFGHTHDAFPGRDVPLPEAGVTSFWNSGSLVAQPAQRPDFLPLSILSDGEIEVLGR